MAEGGENPPVLSYVYKCESCRHEWRALSHQEIGLVCSECQSSKISAPSKRGTYKYLCNECDFKWKKHNSTGGVGFCTKCNIGKSIYPYKFMPNVRKFIACFTAIHTDSTCRLQRECLESLSARNVTVLGKVGMPGRGISSSARTVRRGTYQLTSDRFVHLGFHLTESRSPIRRTSVRNARSLATTADLPQQLVIPKTMKV